MAEYRVELRVKRDTTARWNQCKLFVPEKGRIIVYTDYKKIVDEEGNETFIPGIKIGDGNAYLIDLPFVGDDMRLQIEEAVAKFEEHIANAKIHVSDQDREKWNKKLSLTVKDEVLEFGFAE